MTPQAISGLPTWLHMLAQVYPPQSVALVGAGNGTGPLVQWLQSHASLAGQAAPALPAVTLLEPHAPSMAQLAKRLATTEASAEWRLLPELLAPEQGEHTYHQYTLAAENGLLPPEALHPLWPSLQLQSQQPAATVALAQLLPAGWLLLDCLPAAHLLQDAPLPASTQVVLARVVLSDAAPAGSSLAGVQALLAPSGFKVVATFAERNSGLGKALFVRDPKGLQDHIDQALAKVKTLEADKAQLTEAKDKALAQVQQLEQEKAQAQQRCDELAKAKEAETKANVELQILLDQTRQSKEADAKELKRLQANLTKSIKTEVTNATKQLEAFFGIKSYFETGEVLGELHGWPVSPDLGLYLIQQLEATPYDLVIEFGSGTSTQLMAKALAAIALRHPTRAKPVQVAFEHLAQYHQKTLSVLQQSGHSQSVYLHHTPLAPYHAPDGTAYAYYDCEAQLQECVHRIEKKTELHIFVLVDGPPKSTCVHARYPALPLLLKHFKHAHIDLVLDDYCRPEEKEVAQKWVADLKVLQIAHVFIEEEMDKGACKISVVF